MPRSLNPLQGGALPSCPLTFTSSIALGIRQPHTRVCSPKSYRLRANSQRFRPSDRRPEAGGVGIDRLSLRGVSLLWVAQRSFLAFPARIALSRPKLIHPPTGRRETPLKLSFGGMQ
jgi:hypothetical protein